MRVVLLALLLAGPCSASTVSAYDRAQAWLRKARQAPNAADMAALTNALASDPHSLSIVQALLSKQASGTLTLPFGGQKAVMAATASMSNEADESAPQAPAPTLGKQAALGWKPRSDDDLLAGISQSPLPQQAAPAAPEEEPQAPVVQAPVVQAPPPAPVVQEAPTPVVEAPPPPAPVVQQAPTQALVAQQAEVVQAAPPPPPPAAQEEDSVPVPAEPAPSKPSIKKLKLELAAAVEATDYETAAKLKKQIQAMEKAQEAPPPPPAAPVVEAPPPAAPVVEAPPPAAPAAPEVPAPQPAAVEVPPAAPAAPETAVEVPEAETEVEAPKAPDADPMNGNAVRRAGLLSEDTLLKLRQAGFLGGGGSAPASDDSSASVSAPADSEEQAPKKVPRHWKPSSDDDLLKSIGVDPNAAGADLPAAPEPAAPQPPAQPQAQAGLLSASSSMSTVASVDDSAATENLDFGAERSALLPPQPLHLVHDDDESPAMGNGLQALMKTVNAAPKPKAGLLSSSETVQKKGFMAKKQQTQTQLSFGSATEQGLDKMQNDASALDDATSSYLSQASSDDQAQPQPAASAAAPETAKKNKDPDDDMVAWINGFGKQ